MSLTPQADHATVSRLKAAVLGMIGSFILFSTYLVVPPVGIISGVLAPFPACYVRLLHGRMSAVILTLGVSAGISALFGIFAGCLYLGMSGIIGIFMPELLSRGFSGSRTMFWTVAANISVFVAGALLYSISSGVDLHALVSSEITSSLNQALEIYEKGGVKGEELEIIKRSMDAVADLLYRIYPAFATIMLIIVAGCNLALIKKSTALAGTIKLGEFADYKNPDLLVWLVIASGFSLLLPTQITMTPALNILAVSGLLYFLQGMAVIGVVISRLTFAKVLRIVFYITMALQPYLAVVVAAVGLSDLWIDYRKPKKQENL